MKKYFFPTLMSILILFGILLIVTPYIANWLYPASHSSLRAAKSDEVKKALADWFKVSVADIQEAQGLHQFSAQNSTSWFGFKTSRQAVTRFILSNQLQQHELTPDILQQVFMQQSPAAWWQPAILQRQTYFKGLSDQRELYLIYNEERQQGYMLVKTQEKTHSF